MRIQSPAPAWASKIRSLRLSLKFSQMDLARRFNVSAMTVSRWERGTLAPSTEFYLELGKLAGPDAGWNFWNLAGLSESDVRLMLRDRSRTKDDRIAQVIVALETQAGLSEAQSKRIAATVVHLPTKALRREYRAMSTMDAGWARIIRQQARILKQIYTGKAGNFVQRDGRPKRNRRAHGDREPLSAVAA
jgi:transcriptional regulator with XRE-family HTH domain